jgi:hypothetical protein
MKRLSGGEAAFERIGVHVGEDLGQPIGGGARVDDLVGMGVKRVGGEIRGQHPPLPVDDIGACVQDRRARGGDARLLRLGGGERAMRVPTAPKAMRKQIATSRSRLSARTRCRSRAPRGAGAGSRARSRRGSRPSARARSRGERAERRAGVMARPPRSRHSGEAVQKARPAIRIGLGRARQLGDGAELLGHQRQKLQPGKLISTSSRSRSGRLR